MSYPDYVVDKQGIEHDTLLAMEMCTCGHLRKDHANGEHAQFSKEVAALLAYGHGRCMYGLGISCECQKYTYKSGFDKTMDRVTRK